VIAPRPSQQLDISGDSTLDSPEEAAYNSADNTYRRSKKYTYDLKKLCPVAPSEEALECKSNFKTAEYANTLLQTETVNMEAFNKQFAVLKCAVSKVPSYEISIGVYCFINGAIGHQVKMAKDLTAENPEELAKIIEELRAQKDKETKQEIVKMLDELIAKLQNLLTQIQGVVVAA